MSTQAWICLECGAYFYPSDSNYLCPKCQGKSRPSTRFNPEKHKLLISPEYFPHQEKKCSKCSTAMVPGIITEAAQNIMGLYHHGSVRWTAHGPRFIFPPVNSTFPIAYACPKCGNIELNIILETKFSFIQEKITKWIKGAGLQGYCLNCKSEYNFEQHGYVCPICNKHNTEIKK